MEENLDAKGALRNANVKVAHEYLEQVPDQIASYEDLLPQTLEAVRIQLLEILDMVTKLDEEIQMLVWLAKEDNAKEIATAQKNVIEALNLKINAMYKESTSKYPMLPNFVLLP